MVEILRVMAIVEILWYARIPSMCNQVVCRHFYTLRKTHSRGLCSGSHYDFSERWFACCLLAICCILAPQGL